MSAYDKDIARLKSAPHNLKYADLVRILSKLGYKEQARGQSAGSGVSFYNSTTTDLIFMHRPHPSPDVDRGCLKAIVKHLESQGVI